VPNIREVASAEGNILLEEKGYTFANYDYQAFNNYLYVDWVLW